MKSFIYLTIIQNKASIYVRVDNAYFNIRYSVPNRVYWNFSNENEMSVTHSTISSNVCVTNSPYFLLFSHIICSFFVFRFVEANTKSLQIISQKGYYIMF